MLPPNLLEKCCLSLRDIHERCMKMNGYTPCSNSSLHKNAVKKKDWAKDYDSSLCKVTKTKKFFLVKKVVARLGWIMLKYSYTLQIK
jgi:hypothetical protein